MESDVHILINITETSQAEKYFCLPAFRDLTNLSYNRTDVGAFSYHYSS